jgi:hypothetical protein
MVAQNNRKLDTLQLDQRSIRATKEITLDFGVSEAQEMLRDSAKPPRRQLFDQIRAPDDGA